MKMYFLSIVLALFFSSNAVCATYEGDINPDDILKWETLSGKVQGDIFLANKKPSDASVKDVITCSKILSTDSNGISTLQLIFYIYTKGEYQYVFALDGDNYKELSKRKVLQQKEPCESKDSEKKVHI